MENSDKESKKNKKFLTIFPNLLCKIKMEKKYLQK